MAFPTIPTSGAGRILSVDNTAGGAAGVKTFPNLSSLTKNAGDLLIAICVIYDGNSTNAEFSSWGGGFTEFVDQATTTTMGIGCAYKFSDGTETGTFTVTTADTSTNDSQLILLSIPGAHPSTPPEGGTIANGTSSAANVASLNPAGWGTEDTLWIAVGGCGETSTTGSFTGVTASPTNYGSDFVTSITADVVGGINVCLGFRQLNAASDDPATFTLDTSNARNSCLLLAVRPSLTQALTGTLFQNAPTFPQGAITPGAVNLAGSLFQRAPTFFTGAITSTYPLTGTLFQKAPTFFTGEVTQEDSAQDLAGVLFQSAPTFFQGEVVRLLQELTGTLYQSAPTFFEGAVTPGAVDLAGTLFQKAPTFPTGAVTTGPVDLAGVLFQSAPTFFTGVVVRVVPHGAPPVEAPGNAGGGTAPSQFAALGAELGTRGLSEASTNTGQSSATGASGGSDV